MPNPFWFSIYVHCYQLNCDQARARTHRRVCFRDGSEFDLGNEGVVNPAEIPRNWFAVLVEEH